MGILFDRNARPGKEPTHANGKVDLRKGTGKSTQVYADKYRVSWNHNGSNDEKSAKHWTNQSVGKRSPNRHKPPKR